MSQITKYKYLFFIVSKIKMKPINTILLIILVIFVLIFSNSCSAPGDELNSDSGGNNLANPEQKTRAELRIEIEEMVCNAAEKGGTCDYKLASFGLISKDDCCSKYRACCT